MNNIRDSLWLLRENCIYMTIQTEVCISSINYHNIWKTIVFPLLFLCSMFCQSEGKSGGRKTLVSFERRCVVVFLLWFMEHDVFVSSTDIVCSQKVHRRVNIRKWTKGSDFLHYKRVLREKTSGAMIVVYLFVWGRPPTWKLLISLHPSDGGGRLTAHGGTGHLCLIALTQDLIPGLDDGVTRRNCNRAHKLCKHWRIIQ